MALPQEAFPLPAGEAATVGRLGRGESGGGRSNEEGKMSKGGIGRSKEEGGRGRSGGRWGKGGIDRKGGREKGD